jgi:16S rRNA G1207 methylase RsmC
VTRDGDTPAGDHYFGAVPQVGSDPVEFDVVLPGAGFRLRTDRGVFSHGHLDPGTGVLLRHDHPLPAEGDLLDLGCGAGPIALAMAQRSPRARVWAVDVNERARELCSANARAAGVDNVVVAAPDDVPAEVRFAAIWSNPPIRIGKQALHELLRRWLSRLLEHGEALLVVQRHLGADSLATWLQGEGYEVERLASKSGFRLLRATRVGDRPRS